MVPTVSFRVSGGAADLKEFCFSFVSRYKSFSKPRKDIRTPAEAVLESQLFYLCVYDYESYMVFAIVPKEHWTVQTLPFKTGKSGASEIESFQKRHIGTFSSGLEKILNNYFSEVEKSIEEVKKDA